MTMLFKILSITLMVIFSCFAAVPAQAEDYDLVILNGRVMDPESKLDAVRNVGVKGGKITVRQFLEASKLIQPDKKLGAVLVDQGIKLLVVACNTASSLALDDLAEIGVRRVSIGGALSRLALRAFLDGAKEMRAGRFGFVPQIASIAELHGAFPA